MMSTGIVASLPCILLMDFLQHWYCCVSTQLSSKHLNVRSSCHTLNIDMASLLCVSTHVSSKHLSVGSSCPLWTYEWSLAYVGPLMCLVFGAGKPLSHFEHWNGFSLVLVLSCVFKLPEFDTSGFLSVWVLFVSSKHLSVRSFCHTLNTGMVSLLYRMHSFMWLQRIWLWEALVTLWTLELFLSCVGPLVCLQRTCGWKAIVTLWALRWLLSSCGCLFVLGVNLMLKMLLECYLTHKQFHIHCSFPKAFWISKHNRNKNM